jgi:hypothetical protein
MEEAMMGMVLQQVLSGLNHRIRTADDGLRARLTGQDKTGLRIHEKEVTSLPKK